MDTFDFKKETAKYPSDTYRENYGNIKWKKANPEEVPFDSLPEDLKKVIQQRELEKELAKGYMQ
jgi:hypothetical protein